MRNKLNWKAIVIFVIAFLLLCFLLLSCEIIKGKKSSKSDVSSLRKESVHLIDSSEGGSSRKTDTKVKEEFDWYKMTQLFNNAQKPGDTKVYPSTVIYEGGKGTKETQVNSIDSNWFKNAMSLLQAKLDSANAKIEQSEKNKHSESKGVGLIMVIIIVIIGLIVYKVAGYYFGKFKILKV